LEKAKCVVVFPSMVSGGLVLGGRHGRGVAACRVADRWSGPAFVTLTGGSIGLQGGVEADDLVMLVMNERGVGKLLRPNLDLGAEASVAVGPMGREAEGATDATMSAEFVAYARSRGLFGGVSLGGSVLRHDPKADAALYGTGIGASEILRGERPPPQEAASFLTALRTTFPSTPVRPSI
jgi:lipid-binding SYLF domain-containing protein